MPKVIGELESSLADCIGELAGFRRFVFCPFSLVEFKEEFCNMLNIDEIDESIA